MPSRHFYVYILASKTRRLYVGVTNDLIRRVFAHRCGTASRFTRRYGITRLVCVESTSSVRDAIAREKQIKGWIRCKKIALIEMQNPEWNDLSSEWPECALFGRSFAALRMTDCAQDDRLRSG